MNRYIECLISLPKSLYVSIKLMGLKRGLKIPILVKYNVKLLCLTGKVVDMGGGKIGELIIGFGNVGIVDNKYQRTILQIAGTLTLDFNKSSKRMLFGPGTRVVVYPNANLTIGGGFCTSALTNIICQGTISIGHNFLSSWNTYIMDTDLHGIIDLETGKTGNYVKPISIGNDVWIGMNSSILKGSTIPNGCIVAASSVVSRQFKITNTIIAGNPAVVVKNNIIIDNNTK